MRNPQRIDPMIEQLRALWKANPDWRLGQLVTNIHRPNDSRDLFFTEDDLMAELMADAAELYV